MYQQYLTTYRPARDLRPEDRKAIEVDLISDLPDGYVTEVLYVQGVLETAFSVSWLARYPTMPLDFLSRV